MVEASDGNQAWTGEENLETGGQAQVLTSVGEMSNRLVLWDIPDNWGTLTTSHRLRRLYVQLEAQDKSTVENIVRVYWTTSKSFYCYPLPWPSLWGFKAIDASISSWGFDTANDGQAAMEDLINNVRYPKIRVENIGDAAALCFVKSVYVKLQYDDPVPVSPSSKSGILLGM